MGGGGGRGRAVGAALKEGLRIPLACYTAQGLSLGWLCHRRKNTGKSLGSMLVLRIIATFPLWE